MSYSTSSTPEGINAMASEPSILSRITPKPTQEDIDRIRASDCCGIHEAKKAAKKAWLKTNVENCFTMNDVRVVMAEIVDLL